MFTQCGDKTGDILMFDTLMPVSVADCAQWTSFGVISGA
jgi:hypothetical protein